MAVFPPEEKFATPTDAATPIYFVAAADFFADQALPESARLLAKATRFEPKPNKIFWFSEADRPALAFLGEAPAKADPFAAGLLGHSLPGGVYAFANRPADPAQAALSFLLGAHKFTRYKKPGDSARLVAPEGVDADQIEAIASAVALGRDLIDTPANDLGPQELEAAIHAVAESFSAEVTTISGEKLAKNFPLIQAVGKGSPRAPRLVDLRWNAKASRKLTLVGKGVIFDSGGLDIKPDAAMLLMKKDMGGAAAALAAASMIMAAGLDVALRLIVPIVENAVSGEAFRPGDVYVSRKGLSVEIGNTDAEGRLILADALALADEEAPELLIDFATLTGAARVALGPDLPPFFTDDDALAARIEKIGAEIHDPVWRLPLWRGYEAKLDGKIADLTNAPAGGMAGAITAALFLRRFVDKTPSHVHFDIYGWTPTARPGRPEGGEVQAARLIFALAREMFGVAPERPGEKSVKKSSKKSARKS